MSAAFLYSIGHEPTRAERTGNLVTFFFETLNAGEATALLLGPDFAVCRRYSHAMRERRCSACRGVTSGDDGLRTAWDGPAADGSHLAQAPVGLPPVQPDDAGRADCGRAVPRCGAQDTADKAARGPEPPARLRGRVVRQGVCARDSRAGEYVAGLPLGEMLQ